MGETGSKLKAHQQDHSRDGREIERGDGRERGLDGLGAPERVRAISRKTRKKGPTLQVSGTELPGPGTGPRIMEQRPDRCVGSGGRRGNVTGAQVREVSRGPIVWASLAAEGSWNLFSVSWEIAGWFEARGCRELICLKKKKKRLAAV